MLTPIYVLCHHIHLYSLSPLKALPFQFSALGGKQREGVAGRQRCCSSLAGWSGPRKGERGSMELLARRSGGFLVVLAALLLLELMGGANAWPHHGAVGAGVGAGAGAGELRYRDLAMRRMESVRSSFGARRELATSSASASRVYHVTDYGADPTGGADATAAINKAIADAFRPPSNATMTGGIPDLGGAEIHLDGARDVPRQGPPHAAVLRRRQLQDPQRDAARGGRLPDRPVPDRAVGEGRVGLGLAVVELLLRVRDAEGPDAGLQLPRRWRLGGRLAPSRHRQLLRRALWIGRDRRARRPRDVHPELLPRPAHDCRTGPRREGVHRHWHQAGRQRQLGRRRGHLLRGDRDHGHRGRQHHLRRALLQQGHRVRWHRHLPQDPRADPDVGEQLLHGLHCHRRRGPRAAARVGLLLPRRRQRRAQGGEWHRQGRADRGQHVQREEQWSGHRAARRQVRDGGAGVRAAERGHRHDGEVDVGAGVGGGERELVDGGLLAGAAVPGPDRARAVLAGGRQRVPGAHAQERVRQPGRRRHGQGRVGHRPRARRPEQQLKPSVHAACCDCMRARRVSFVLTSCVPFVL